MQNTASAIDEFGQRLSDYKVWRTRLTAAIESYSTLYGAHHQPDTIEELRLFELIEELRTDTLVIALVGEFSRGKTELINALFFGDYNRRLLPSTPGRTTMCPTEILYNEKLDPCIRLLPIETRKSPLTIAELKKRPINWTTLPLDLNSPDAMAEMLEEILKSKKIGRQEAQDIGLLDVSPERERQEESIEVPIWRHAIINYPHPLLKQGLVVLDTPGLNALGAEPELTLNMLPKAHAILFVLAADTGVTKTDMEIWKNHVSAAGHQNSEGRIVVLNKIDTLWDELQDPTTIDGFINRQAEETRHLLQVDRHRIFPVSAQKGLLGKIRKNEQLVTSSGLPDLESMLSEKIVFYKQKIICDKIANEIGPVVQSSQNLIQIQIDSLRAELSEIHDLRGRSSHVISEMADKLKRQRDDYTMEVQSFHITRRMLAGQVNRLLELLSTPRFDELIANTRLTMSHSWTTPGLKRGMQTFFGGTFSDLEEVESQSEEIRRLVEKIYKRFHGVHGLPKMQPAGFSVLAYMHQYKNLYEDAENFRKSPSMMVVEQHFVINKFFITLVSRARVIFQECNRSARNWAKSVLTPIHVQIEEHKTTIDRRLDNLEKLRGNHTSLSERQDGIEQDLRSLHNQAALIESIMTNIYEPVQPVKN